MFDLAHANQYKISQIQVWFEPTDTRKAGKVFQSRHWTSLGYVSPNLNELQVMSQASGLFFSLSQFHSASEDDNILNEASFLARNLVEHIGAAIVTLGRLGVLVAREGEANEPLLQSSRDIPRNRSSVSVRHYALPLSITECRIVNVSGAGDCLAAGMLEAMLRGLSETECVSVGFSAAAWSLQSSCAVPLNTPHTNIPVCAEFTVIHP